MKKIMFAAVSALALSALADGVDSTQFGVLTVPSSQKQTIVAVPWLEAGTGTDPVINAVTVSNLVLTSGLNVGDELMYYQNGSYVSWVIASNTTTHVKYWTPGNNVTVSGVTVSDASSDVTIPRGGAVLLKRDDPGECFYIMGKPVESTAESGSYSLPSGSSTVAAYALIAPPKVAATKLSALTWSGLAAKKDYLFLGNDSTMEICTWSGTIWKCNGEDASNKEIPMGEGVWFMSRGSGTGEKKVTW